jgi:hypothetical protein
MNIFINEVGPAIREVAHEDQKVWFQPDGCPAHFGVNVRATAALSKSLDWSWWYHKLAGQIS